MQIRPLEDADIPEVARLLRSLALEFIVHESSREAATTFLRENDEDGLRGYLATGHAYHIARIDGELAGFIAVRERRHLFHLFVAKRWQRQGVALGLWEVARRAAQGDSGDASFTVNSSNFGVPAYEALGFVRTAPPQCKDGLYFNPMELKPATADGPKKSRAFSAAPVT